MNARKYEDEIMLVDQHEMMKMWEEYMVKLFDDNTGLQPVLQNEEGKFVYNERGSGKSNQRTGKPVARCCS